MFDPIVVPLDGSSFAEAVLPYVEQLGRVFQAHVRLLHVIDPEQFLGELVLDDPQQRARYEEFVEDGRRQATKYLKRQQVGPSLRDIESKTSVLRIKKDDPAGTIAEYAEQQGAGLIRDDHSWTRWIG